MLPGTCAHVNQTILVSTTNVCSGHWVARPLQVRNQHECTWFGLTCDDAPKLFDWHEYIDADAYHAITEISLSDNNLVGELPIEFYRELDTLQVLDMK